MEEPEWSRPARPRSSPVCHRTGNPDDDEEGDHRDKKAKAEADKNRLTDEQQDAVGAAEDYLDFTAFSRKGLIQQLSSDAGSGFSKKDATIAVDSMDIDYKEQAVKAAKSYRDFSHFSRKGLIQQLESSYGSGFTHDQAVYGADHSR